MDKLPSIKGKNLVRFLIKVLDFELLGVEGSHHILGHEDGRRVTVSVHTSGRKREIRPGTLRKIIRDDLDMEKDKFCHLYSRRAKDKKEKEA